MSEFYVYIYWRLDTNEPFYVGKGKEDRWKDLRGRNNHFMNILNTIPIVCEIVKDNLTENQAFYWEEEIIRRLVFEYGFSIDIKNANSSDHYCHLCNMTWGGDGNSRVHTKKEKIKQSETMKGKYVGENHPLWGKHHTDETKEKISKTQIERYKNGIVSNFKGKHHTEESKEKNRHAHLGKGLGKENGNAKSVICLTTKRIFLTLKDGAEYYKVRDTSIIMCCKGYRITKGKKMKIKSAGKLPNGTPLVWRKIVWNHSKTYRVKGGE